MKRFWVMLLAAAMLCGLFAGCSNEKVDDPVNDGTGAAVLGDDDDSFGENLDELNAYGGYFEEVTEDVTVTCVSGTEGCYTLENGTLTFTAVSEDSVYAVSGQLKGNIVIDIGDDYKFDLELQGLSLVSDTACPVMILSGDKVSLTAKKEFENYIYDTREAVDPEDETAYSGAVYSKADLELCGKGCLTVVSENNNGVHSKDDLDVKNLTLLVACTDNALKGNDSVTLESGTTTLIATQGDGIKTTNTDISDKGNQRGTITVSGGSHTVYAACDGLDAAYDVVIEGSETVLNVYTDKYSNYSSEVTSVSSDQYYIRINSDYYCYSVKYYNSDSDYIWEDAEYHSSISGGMSKYYYYSYPIHTEYDTVYYYFWEDEDARAGRDEDDALLEMEFSFNSAYDTLALTIQGGYVYYDFTNYTTSLQNNQMGHGGGGFGGGPGGMNEGNSDKGDHSTKGLKAGNAVSITDGTVNIKSYDDAVHANSDSTLENGDSPAGNVTVSGGSITLYSNDDGLHADGVVAISGGTVYVVNAYEGVEGATVDISGGWVSVTCSDDGINSTVTSGTGVTISGGMVYIYCSGDGIDANTRSSNEGIVFAGGKTVVISNSGGNSAIDTEKGYTYSGGQVLAVMPSGGMTGEATNCSNFNSVATKKSVSLQSGSYLTVEVGGQTAVAVQMPCSVNATVIYLGSKSASLSAESSVSVELNESGTYWAD